LERSFVPRTASVVSANEFQGFLKEMAKDGTVEGEDVHKRDRASFPGRLLQEIPRAVSSPSRRGLE
jgi:hypothetical protein